jgi:hypothetical protein
MCNNLSFNIINDPTFHALVKHPSESIKDESRYRKDVLPKTYKAVRAKVLEDLKECEFLSFSSDAWSGITDNFMRFILSSKIKIIIYVKRIKT